MSWQLSALDRLEIQELYARYAWGIDLADLPMAMSTFTQDAWFDHLWQGKVQGHAAIAENLKSLWYDRQHWWIGRQHLMNHFIMEPREQEGEADVRCFFQIIQHNVEYKNNFVFGIGTRIDHVTKQGRPLEIPEPVGERLDAAGRHSLAGRDHHQAAAAGADLQSESRRASREGHRRRQPGQGRSACAGIARARGAARRRDAGAPGRHRHLPHRSARASGPPFAAADRAGPRRRGRGRIAGRRRARLRGRRSCDPQRQFLRPLPELPGEPPHLLRPGHAAVLRRQAARWLHRAPCGDASGAFALLRPVELRHAHAWCRSARR